MMEFDEYDYLERTVDNPELEKVKYTANGGDGAALKSGEKDRDRHPKHKSDEKERDEDRQSKRSRSGDDSRDQERRREGRSSHHRSRSKDGEKDRGGRGQEQEVRDRDRDREERNGKDRDKDREHRERDREHRERDRERDHPREKRDRDSERDKEKERSRRSSSRSERPRSERDERDGEKSRVGEREFRGREPRENRKKREDGTEPEADPERDQRTVFAYQLSLKADERDVYEFFSRAGKVRDVRLIMDRNSRRSKGVGYIEFYDVMSVPMAIALSGQPLLGQPVMVKPSEAEKNLVQSTAAATAASGAGGTYSGGVRRLYVGNLHVNITEDQLRQVFEAFGQVELVQLPLDETGHCKGFGFIQFARLEDARNALSLNGQLELAGRTIKVSTVTDPTGIQETLMNPTDLDDDDGGLSLNASTRALLIQRLARSDSSAGSPIVPGVGSGVVMPTAPVFGTQPLVPGVVPLVQSSAGMLPGFPPSATTSLDTVGIPSECLLLKNMFDPKLETEPDFDLDIKEDVQEECTKYGNLKHIHVDKDTAGFVYLWFENTQSAMGAQRALHGRWFAGKMITATYMAPLAYEEKFPQSR